jgi:hypothetical protein
MNPNMPMYQAMQQMPAGYGPAAFGPGGPQQGGPMPGGPMPGGFGPDSDDDTYDDPRQHMPQHHEVVPGWAHQLAARLDEIEHELGQLAGHGGGGGGAYPPMHPQHAMALHTVGQMMKGPAADQLIQKVAGDLGPEAQDFVRQQCQGLDAMAIGRILNSPQIIAFLRRAAQMEHHEKSGPGTSAPQGEGVWHGGDNLDGDAQKEIQSYLSAFGPMGATHEMAVRAYRRATGGGR